MKHLPILLLLMLTSSFILAQKKSPKAYFSKSFQLKKFGLLIGKDQDMPHGLSHNYLLNTARLGGDIDISSLTENKEYNYSMICENPHIRVELEWLLPNLKNTALVTGVYSISGRIDVATYDKLESNAKGEYIPRSLSIKSMGNEVGIETSIFRYLPLSRSFRIIVGGGTNLGYSYDGTVTIQATNIDVLKDDELSFRAIPSDRETVSQEDHFSEFYEEHFDQKNGIHQRLVGQIGGGLMLFNRFELQFILRRGVGYRYLSNVPLKLTELRSFSLGAKWVIK